MTTDLLSLSAVSAVREFARGTLSPVELIDAVIAHAERVEPEVNAFMATFYEQALQEARTAEDRWQGIGDPPRPLEGVPLAVSDDLEIAGQPLTESSVLLVDHEVTETEPLAERLIASGAVVHARTATSELLCSPYMHSELYGSTACPWNRDYNASGGAGGAGAALAVGTTVLAGGLDSLGCTSAAATCGLASLKPSYGRIPLVYPFALDTYSQYSPMARSVADCALLYDQLKGPHPRDPASLPWTDHVGELEPEVAKMRVAWSEDLGGYDVHPEVRANTRAAMMRLADAGARVDEVAIQFDPKEIGDTILRHTGHVLLPMMARHYARKEQMAPHTGVLLDRALAAAEAGPLTDAIVVETRLYAELAEIFARYDALVCPALAVPGFPLVPDESDFTQALTGAAFTICNRHPAVSLPSGLSKDGVPTGLLVVGPRHAEAAALGIAAAAEATAEPLGRPPAER